MVTPPPLHCIGALVKKSEEVGANRHDCLAWLDAQPEASVVFLCFGSMGRFSVEQTWQVARGQQFLWVLRRPPGDNDWQQPNDPADLDTLLLEGFLTRTEDKGAGGQVMDAAARGARPRRGGRVRDALRPVLGAPSSRGRRADAGVADVQGAAEELRCS
jgi:hypothetical protein